MLMTNLKLGQSVLIGNVRVKIHRVAGRRAGGPEVYLAIDAPPEVPVFRGELSAAARAELTRRCKERREGENDGK